MQLHFLDTFPSANPFTLRLLLDSPPRNHHRWGHCRLRAASTARGARKWYGAHMVATVLTAIFQGSVSMLIYTRPKDFLGNLKSYVREEDEWVVLTLAFFLNYYAYVQKDGVNSHAMKSSKVQDEDDLKNWPWPFLFIHWRNFLCKVFLFIGGILCDSLDFIGGDG
ncbi:Uncharacterized protein Fot_42520 [Forsythia ovata]|uniref:Uncharacterized protein n=1 Tax=Forsythia ovata TaxID=205694 RepID=A0ABD1RLE4_9LAMI